jgi:23S rRNA pseudouridine2605 synthase
MFELIGHSVLKLRRVRIGFLTDENLKPGYWRFLTQGEVVRLMKKDVAKRSPKSRVAKRA